MGGVALEEVWRYWRKCRCYHSVVETGSLKVWNSPEVQAGCPAGTKDLPLSTFPALGSPRHTLCYKSGPCACTASTLLTKPSPEHEPLTLRSETIVRNVKGKLPWIKGHRKGASRKQLSAYRCTSQWVRSGGRYKIGTR